MEHRHGPTGQQATGVVRPDIDPAAIAEGLITIVLSLLMSLVQTRSSAEDLAGRAVAVLHAALAPVVAPAPAPARSRR